MPCLLIFLFTRICEKDSISQFSLMCIHKIKPWETKIEKLIEVTSFSSPAVSERETASSL